MVSVVKDNNAEIVQQTDREEDEDVKNKVFKHITEKNLKELKNLFSENHLKPNICDSDGITPLQHACYKGDKAMVEFLIELGADVNYTQHKYGYTALHFAALSGQSDLCLLMLIAGAKSHVTNSLGKTAAQMAAFVGNHDCVTVINNYVPQSDVDYYTIPRGIETTPKLAPTLKTPLYSYIIQVNIHPVRLAMKMPKILLEEYSQVKKVLELMSEQEMKKGLESNEVLSFKFHYLGYILTEIHKIALTKKETDPVEAFAKKILKGPRGEEYLDLLLRDCVREFPYRDGFLFQQMVKSLARKDESLPALSVITGAINSQSHFDEDNNPCVTCSEPKAVKKCSKCKAVQYCDRECQRLHWFMHKKECARTTTGASKEKVSENDDLEDSSIVAEASSEMQSLSI